MTIFCYHSLQPDWNSPLAVRPKAFEQQWRWLARNRPVLDLASAVTRLNRYGLISGGTALTFDDGFADLYYYAFPLLLRHQLPATIFLVAETLTQQGRPVDWINPAPPLPPATLGLDQVLEMKEAGIRFGSHSYAHRNLTLLTQQECEEDLRTSRELLEELLGCPVPFLAYPGGYHNPAVQEAAEKAGFTHAFGTVRGHDPVGSYSLPRVGVYRSNSLLTLRLKTSWWYMKVRRSKLFSSVRLASKHLRR